MYIEHVKIETYVVKATQALLKKKVSCQKKSGLPVIFYFGKMCIDFITQGPAYLIHSDTYLAAYFKIFFMIIWSNYNPEFLMFFSGSPKVLTFTKNLMKVILICLVF